MSLRLRTDDLTYYKGQGGWFFRLGKSGGQRITHLVVFRGTVYKTFFIKRCVIRRADGTPLCLIKRVVSSKQKIFWYEIENPDSLIEAVSKPMSVAA